MPYIVASYQKYSRPTLLTRNLFKSSNHNTKTLTLTDTGGLDLETRWLGMSWFWNKLTDITCMRARQWLDCLVFHLYRYDTGKDKFIDFEELKHMMEKLGVPQTHLCLKEMIKEVDEDFDGKISFREVCTNCVINILHCPF